jgi:hypothetical protein
MDALRPVSLPDGQPADYHVLILNYLKEHNALFSPPNIACFFFFLGLWFRVSWIMGIIVQLDITD